MAPGELDDAPFPSLGLLCCWDRGAGRSDHRWSFHEEDRRRSRLAGKDHINVDFGGRAGFSDDDPFELAATKKAFRLRVDGRLGPDMIDEYLSNSATATFACCVAIQGGSRRSDIIFVEVNPGRHTTFGPSGSVFIDGGLACTAM
jgi:hypothetical protein